MVWIKLNDGKVYTFAPYIQRAAEKELGYAVPVETKDEGEEQRHPGTDCNNRLRSAYKNLGIRTVCGLNEYSVLDVLKDACDANGKFFQWLHDKGIMPPNYSGKGVIQIYTPGAASAIITMMLKEDGQVYDVDPTVFDVVECPYPVVTQIHGLEKKKYRPRASLFNK